MAISFNLPGIPAQIRGTPEEAGAVPDLGQAMIQGFRSNIENVQGYPRQLAQQLLSNQLANKIRGVEAQFAEPMAKTAYDKALFDLASSKQLLPLELQAKQAQINLAPLEQQFKQAQIQAQLAKAAKDSGAIIGDRIPLTTGAKTAAQKNIGYYRKTLESMDQLLGLKDTEIPGMISVESTYPKYLSSLAKVKDQFAKAESFPGTIPGMKASEDVMRKYRTESVGEYRKRIGALKNEIENALKSELENLRLGMPANQIQKPKKTAQDLSPEELIKLKQYRMQRQGV